MHGGSKGSGAPKGKANGRYRHGRYAGEHLRSIKLFRVCARVTKEWLKEVDGE